MASKALRQGCLDEAVNAAEIMYQQGILISKQQASFLLQECKKHHDLESGRRFQYLLGNVGLDSTANLADHLVHLFSSRGHLIEAKQAFYKVSKPSEYTWNAIIQAHSKLGGGNCALHMHSKMLLSGVISDKYSYLAALKACISTSGLEHGRCIHEQVIHNGFQCDITLGNTLVDMYAKCGSLLESSNLFAKLPTRDVVTWSVMIAGYAQHGETFLALECLIRMQEEDTKPNKVTYLSMLKACSNTGAIGCGRFIHGQLVECGLDVDIAIGNALVDMYARCGSLEESQMVFNELENRDIVSWGAIISGYTQNGRNFAALDCYRKMEQEGTKADRVTFLSVLKACGSLGDVEQGRCIHEEIIETGLHLDVIIGSTLVDMYAKFGSLEESHILFCKLKDRDLVSYSAIIGGYAQHGEGLEAIQLLEQMQMEAIKPDKVTFLNILKACGNIGAIDWGKLIHEQIFKMGLQSDVSVGNALVEMYAKCGHLEESREVLNRLENCDVASWNSMISGYARAGNAQLAGQCLKEMQQQGITPDDTTFTNLLGACSHAGLVDDAQHFIESMKEYGLMLNMCQYNCIVDLFSRAGLLNEAETLLQTMHSDCIGWKSLLAACKTYGNVVLGRRCFTEVLKLDPQDAAGYLLMSGIYSDSCMWNDAVNVEFLRHSTGAWKKPAKAWIEINNRVHEFVVRDKRHPQSAKIYAMLKKLWIQMKEAGYMPKLDLVLQPMSDKDKEDALCGHCEKLAIAFGLLSTSPHATLRITKNLRVCLDCHNASKIISKIELREIVIMDGYRLHHFKDGLCSCGDYY